MAINSLSSTSKGLSGLASGMDTQSMVDAMLAGTQAKIDKQKGNKAILGYKQTMYRDIFSGLKGFQDNFMSFSGKNNMLSSTFYNTMTAASKANAFKVSGTSTANAGKTTVNSIDQLAKSAYVKTGNMKIAGAVSGELDLKKLDGKQQIQVKLDGVTKTIDLPAAVEGTVMQPEDLRKSLQSSIDKAFGNGIKVNVDGNKLSFVPTDTSREFSISGSSSAMDVLGMPNGISNKLNTALTLADLNFATPLVGGQFKFTINDTEFSFSENTSMDKVISTINSSDANVRLRYSSLDDKFIMESTVSGDGSNITMSQESGNLLTAMFGTKTGSSYSGSSFTSYGDMTGKLAGVNIDYKEGTALTDEDIVAIAKAMESLTNDINRATKDGTFTMAFRIDGKEVNVVLPKRELTDPADPDSPLKEYKFEDIINAVNKNETFVKEGISISLNEDINGMLTGGLKVNVPTGTKLEIGAGTQNLFGLSSSNGKVSTGSDSLASAGVGDFEISFTDVKGDKQTIAITADMTMDEVAKKIKDDFAAKYDPDNPKEISVDFDKENKAGFRIFGIDIPITFDMGVEGSKLFGAKELEFGKVDEANAMTSVGGQNAKLMINGIAVERNSNEFTIDGLSYELRDTFNVGNTDSTKAETIEVTRDNTKIFDGISKFMEEYNKLVEKSWGMLKAEPTYKDYPPLTDKQKESMSEKEIELWDKKAQEGLLRGDQTIEGIMDEMRRTLSNRPIISAPGVEPPEYSKYSLADMGISVSYDIEKGIGGKLVFSDGTGEKLKQIIAEEPGEVEQLFSNADHGLIPELNKIVYGATTMASGEAAQKIPYSNLSLANLAGRPGFPDTSSKIYNEVRDINKNLEALNLKYNAEYKRYWAQFNSMEKMIASMNQQSSWLTQQLQ